MNTSLGYAKKTLTDSNVLLSGGGDKALSEFIGSLNWDSTNKKLQYKSASSTNFTDLITFGSNAFTSYSGYNIVFLNNAGTTVDTFKALTSPNKTLKAGTNVQMTAANNVITITATDTWTAWAGATDSANGVAGYMPAPTSALRGQFLRGDGTWVSLNNYSLPTASNSTLGGVKTGAAITDTTGYTAMAIKDGVIYYKDTTYSFSNLLFLQTSGTNLMTYNSQAVRTVLAGSNITFTHSNNVLTIAATDTTYSTVSKTAAGLCPTLPNETTTTKYLRLDGSWTVPAYPTKSSWNYNDMYVASVSISDNNLRINKNGANTDLTIPYATNADTVDSRHATGFVYWEGNPSKNNMNDIARSFYSSAGMTQLASSSVDNGDMSGWTHFFSTSYSDGGNSSNSWVFLLACPAGSNNLQFRSRNGGTITDGTAWTVGWTKILHADNYSSYALPLSGGTMTGDITMGSNSIVFSQSHTSNWNVSANTGIMLLNTVGASATGAPGSYHVGLSVSGYYGFQLAAYGGGGRLLFRNTQRGTYPSWSEIAYLSDIPTSLPANGGNAATVTTITKAQVTGALGYTPPTTNSTYNFSGTTFRSGYSSGEQHDCNNAWENGHYYYNANGPSGLGNSTTDGALYVQSYNSSWVGQIAQDYRNGRLWVRGKNNGTWQSWVRIANYNEVALASHTHAYSQITDGISSSTNSNWSRTLSNTYGGSLKSILYMCHGGGYGMHIRGYSTSASVYMLQIYNSSKEVFGVYGDGHSNFGGNVNATNYYTTSDRNKKQNISLFSEHIRKFQMKDTKTWHYGVIAQEVPEMFRNGEEGNMTVNYNSVLSYYVGLLENKVKELEEKIKVLETKLSKLI